MRMQDTAANCGPASVSNALQAVGVVRSQQECEALCKTSGTDGTSSRNLVKAVQAAGRSGLVVKEKRPAVAMLMLRFWLQQGKPVILCVDDATHWVAAVGTLGPDRILVADPADNELVVTCDSAEMVEWWASTGGYYGVVV